MKRAIRLFLSLAVLVSATPFCGSAEAATYVKQDVGAGPPVELFQFTTPSGSPASNWMIVTRFLVDDTTSDLVFQVAPAAPSSIYSPKDFAVCLLAGCTDAANAALTTNQILPDNDSTLGVFELRARDLSNGTPPEATGTGYRLIKLSIKTQSGYSFASSLTWSVRAWPVSAGSRTYSGFWDQADGSDAAAVESALDDSVTQPHAEILDAVTGDPITGLEFGRVQVSVMDDLRPILFFKVFNAGTETLHPPPAPSPASPFFRPSDWVWTQALLPGERTGLPTDASPLGVTAVGFHPTARGTAGNQGTLSFAVANTDPAQTAELALSGTGISTDAALLLDASGSMCYAPSDTSGSSPSDCVNPEQSRMWQAKQSTSELYLGYKGLTEGGPNRFGLYTFPDWTDSTHPSCGATGSATANTDLAITAVTSVESPLQGLVGSSSSGIQPFWNSTPMATGIACAQENLRTDDDFYSRLIVLLSDGKHNLDSPSPPRTPDDWIPLLADKEIKVYAVAYGMPGVSSTDHPLLQRLADGTMGRKYDVDPAEFFTSDSGLKKAFQQALEEFLGLNSVADPAATLPAGGRATHSVCIEPTAQTMTVFLDWEKTQDNAISLSLEGPHGQSFSGSGSGVFFRKDKTYALYVVRPRHMTGGRGAGEWKLKLTGRNDEPLPYNYTVLTQSPQKVGNNIDRSSLLTQAAFLAEIDLRHVFPVPPPEPPVIKLGVSRPTRSLGTYLSDAKVDPEFLAGRKPMPEKRVRAGLVSPALAAETQSKAPSDLGTPMERKIWALNNVLKQPFDPARKQEEIQLYDDRTHGDRVAGDGIYSGQIVLKIDGAYDFRLVLDNRTPNACLQRDLRVNRFVGVKVSLERAAEMVELRPLAESPFFGDELAKRLSEPPPAGRVRGGVTFAPHDEFGNKMGPGYASQIQLEVSDAEPLGALVDNLDGTYVQAIEYAKGARPAVAVGVGGERSAPMPLVKGGTTPPAWLWLVVIVVIVVLAGWWLLKRS